MLFAGYILQTGSRNVWEINLISNTFANINEICTSKKKYFTKEILNKSCEMFIEKHKNDILCTHRHLDHCVSSHCAGDWILMSMKCGM